MSISPIWLKLYFGSCYEDDQLEDDIQNHNKGNAKND